MARPRSTTELARLLNTAAPPVYILDDQGVIVFCNEACQAWLGPAAEDLVGQRCAYHSAADATGPEAAAARLCPPPEVMAGQRATASVACLAEDGTLVHRRATFLPLGATADDLIGVVAMLDAADLAEPAATALPAAEAPAAELHEHLRQFRRQAAGRCRADRLVGRSPAICRARRQIALAASHRSSVLLIGPAGSGRQHLASAIHYGDDPDAAGTLVPLDCGVLGAELIHSTVAALASGELMLDKAQRSTLVLNDADQIPPEIQCELARVLGSHSFPLRLVATAEQPLGDLVRRAKYREDLASLLATIAIELPPLAERREDLPLLAQSLVEEANARGEKQLGGFAPEALDQLDAYRWPGNLDELAQVVAEAHRRAEGPLIAVADLPERIHVAAQAAAHPRRAEETIVLDEFLARVERELIRRALALAKGNKAKAARLLGMTRPRLYRRMVHLGLEG